MHISPDRSSHHRSLGYRLQQQSTEKRISTHTQTNTALWLITQPNSCPKIIIAISTLTCAVVGIVSFTMAAGGGWYAGVCPSASVR